MLDVMSMEDEEDLAPLGSYLPRAFSVTLSHPAIGKQPMSGPLQIPRAAFSTLMHEFAHLIQDWSTFRGVIDFLNMWDQVGAVSDLAERSGTVVPYPVVEAGGKRHRLTAATLYARELDQIRAVTQPREKWTKGEPSWKYRKHEVKNHTVRLAGNDINCPLVWVYLEDETKGTTIKHRLGAWEIKEAYSVAVGMLHGGKPKVAGKVGFEYIVVGLVLAHYFDNVTPLQTIAVCHWALQDIAPANTLFALAERVASGGRNLPPSEELYEACRAEAMSRDFERNAREIIDSVDRTAQHHNSYGNDTLVRHLRWYGAHAKKLLHLHLDPKRRFPLDTFLCADSTGFAEAEFRRRLEGLFKEVHLPLLFWPDGSTHTIGDDPGTVAEAFFIRCVVDLLGEVWRGTEASWDCPVYGGCNLQLKDPTDCKSRPWKKAWVHPTCPYGAAAAQFGITPSKSFQLTPFVGPVEGSQFPAVDELTHKEHAEARRRAYVFALERGGGQLPTYDPEKMHEDFCKAAGLVKAMRPGPEKEPART